MSVSVGRSRFVATTASSAGYPDSSNTGVPAGTSLTLHNGDFDTTSTNQVIDSLDIRGSLNIHHTGVHITKCKVSEFSICGIACEAPSSALIEDCTVDGGWTSGNGIWQDNITVRRCDIYGVENGMHLVSNVLIEDCFIHDLYDGVDSHNDGIQFAEGSNGITIRHCSILSLGLNGLETTSAIIMQRDFEGGGNILIEDNVLAGGAYTLYGIQGGTLPNVTIRNNKFWKLYHATTSGAFGNWTDCIDETVSGNELGAFSGGYNYSTKRIQGTWSGVPLTTEP